MGRQQPSNEPRCKNAKMCYNERSTNGRGYSTCICWQFQSYEHVKTKMLLTQPQNAHLKTYCCISHHPSPAAHFVVLNLNSTSLGCEKRRLMRPLKTFTSTSTYKHICTNTRINMWLGSVPARDHRTSSIASRTRSMPALQHTHEPAIPS